MNTITYCLLPLSCALIIIAGLYFVYSLCYAASVADDARKNEMIHKMAADTETERKLKKALKPLREMEAGIGKRKWDARLEDE